MIHVRTLTDKQQTGTEMARLVREYAQDLQLVRNVQGVPLSDLSLPQFFNFVRQIQYKQDREGVEIVTRPWHSLTTSWRHGLDCKKKAILIASWLQLHGVPWRFTAVSSRTNGEIHHVIVEAWQGGRWIEIDATYPQNSLGVSKPWTAKESLAGAGGSFASDPVLVSISGTGDPCPQDDRQFAIIRERVCVATMGQGETAAGAVVAIVVAIVAAVSSVTVAIVAAASDKNRQERQFAFEAQQVKTSATLAAQAAARAAAERQAEADRQKEMLIKFILPATAVAGGLILFAGGKKNVS